MIECIRMMALDILHTFGGPNFKSLSNIYEIRQFKRLYNVWLYIKRLVLIFVSKSNL